MVSIILNVLITALVILDAILLAFYIALRFSEPLLDWFDEFLEPIRNLFDKGNDTEEV